MKLFCNTCVFIDKVYFLKI